MQASNAYEIQKDARTLLDDYGNDPDFRAFVAGTLIDPAKEDTQRGTLWKMVNFYKSVYRQADLGGLSGEFVSSFKTDFCQFIAMPGPKATWAKWKAEDQLGAKNEEMYQSWCNKT